MQSPKVTTHLMNALFQVIWPLTLPATATLTVPNLETKSAYQLQFESGMSHKLTSWILFTVRGHCLRREVGLAPGCRSPGKVTVWILPPFPHLHPGPWYVRSLIPTNKNCPTPLPRWTEIPRNQEPRDKRLLSLQLLLPGILVIDIKVTNALPTACGKPSEPQREPAAHRLQGYY